MQSGEMTLTVNGEEHHLPCGLTVADLLERLSLHRGRIAVERNREILPRGRFSEVVLHDGDRLEIVHFVGGG